MIISIVETFIIVFEMIMGCLIIFREFYTRLGRAILSSLYTFLIWCTFIFASANLLSILECYNKFGVFVFWNLITVVLAIVALKNNKNSKELQQTLTSKTKFKSPYTMIHKVVIMSMILAIIVVIIFSILRAALYPVMVVDSNVYHMARAFYYYKMQKIDFIPFPSETYLFAINYHGPAHAIFLSYILILCDGRDFAVNFVQIPGTIVILCAIYEICVELKLKKKICILASLVGGTLPIIILQSGTTNTDILVATFCVLAVLFLLRIYYSIENGKADMLSALGLGLAIGAAMLAKITSVVVLFFWILAVAIYALVKKKNYAIKVLGVVFACTFFICATYWFRNFQDLDGDFLAISYSRKWFDQAEELQLIDFVGRIVINIGWNFMEFFKPLSDAILVIIQKIYTYMGAGECEQWFTFVLPTGASSDGHPFGIRFLLGFFSSILIVLSKRTTSKHHKFFAIVSLGALLFSSMTVAHPIFYKPSSSRWLMAAGIITTINLCIYMNDVYEMAVQNVGKKTSRYTVQIVKGIYTMVLFVTIISIAKTYTRDVTQPLNIEYTLATTYEEKMDRFYGRENWSETKRIFMEYIEENDIQQIGIWEQVLSGNYPMLRELVSDNYKVKSIYQNFGIHMEENLFVPDVIIYVGDRDNIPNELEYNNVEYKKEIIGNNLAYNNAQAILYTKE